MKNFKTGKINYFLVLSMSISTYGLTAQNEVTKSIPQDNQEVVKNSNPTDQKYSQESFFIINDKPATREEYMKFLDSKKEDENNSIPK